MGCRIRERSRVNPTCRYAPNAYRRAPRRPEPPSREPTLRSQRSSPDKLGKIGTGRDMVYDHITTRFPHLARMPTRYSLAERFSREWSPGESAQTRERSALKGDLWKRLRAAQRESFNVAKPTYGEGSNGVERRAPAQSVSWVEWSPHGSAASPERPAKGGTTATTPWQSMWANRPQLWKRCVSSEVRQRAFETLSAVSMPSGTGSRRLVQGALDHRAALIVSCWLAASSVLWAVVLVRLALKLRVRCRCRSASRLKQGSAASGTCALLL